MKEIFFEAMKNKKKVKIKILNKNKKNVNEVLCIPFDFAPPKKQPSEKETFHFYNIDTLDQDYYFTVNPEELFSIEISEETYNPIE